MWVLDLLLNLPYLTSVETRTNKGIGASKTTKAEDL